MANFALLNLDRMWIFFFINVLSYQGSSGISILRLRTAIGDMNHHSVVSFMNQ